MRIDSIQVPFIEYSSHTRDKNVSIEINNTDKKFSSILNANEYKNENEVINVEKNNYRNVDDSVEVDENFNSEDTNENDIGELVYELNPIFISFINFYKENLNEHNISMINEIRLDKHLGKLKDIISKFVDEIPNTIDIHRNLETNSKINSDLIVNLLVMFRDKNKDLNTINIDTNNNNINEAINKNTLNKEFTKFFMEGVFKSINSIEPEVNTIGQVFLRLQNKDEFRMLVNNTIKGIVKDSRYLENGLNNQFLKVFEEYIPKKHVYVNENANESKSKEVSIIKTSINEEDSFLKSLIDEDEKISKSDFILRNDIKTFTPLKELNKTERVPIINRENIITDVIKAIRYMERNEQRELTVKIYPKELGEISIKIIAGASEGVIKASITATSKETYSILNSNINELKQNIINSEIKISEVNISLYNQDTTFYRDQSNQEYKGNNGNSLNEDASVYKDIDDIDDEYNEGNHLGDLSILV